MLRSMLAVLGIAVVHLGMSLAFMMTCFAERIGPDGYWELVSHGAAVDAFCRAGLAGAYAYGLLFQDLSWTSLAVNSVLWGLTLVASCRIIVRWRRSRPTR